MVKLKSLQLKLKFLRFALRLITSKTLRLLKNQALLYLTPQSSQVAITNKRNLKVRLLQAINKRTLKEVMNKIKREINGRKKKVNQKIGEILKATNLNHNNTNKTSNITNNRISNMMTTMEEIDVEDIMQAEEEEVIITKVKEGVIIREEVHIISKRGKSENFNKTQMKH